MTMAPGRRKRGYWLEIVFISILLFLLMGSLKQSISGTGSRTEFQSPLQRSLSVSPVMLK